MRFWIRLLNREIDLQLFCRTTILIIITALIVAILCINEHTRNTTPIWVVSMAAGFCDTMFHELGHAAFAWLFGVPAIPSIFTFIGREQASGLTLAFERSWVMQIAVLFTLITLCYGSYKREGFFFKHLLALTAFVLAIAILGWHEPIISFMGHGASIIIGCFFIFRALVNIQSRNIFERWLNAFFGIFMLVGNISFSWSLAFDSFARNDYGRGLIGGAIHHDFKQIAMTIPGGTIEGVAIFTIAFGLLCMVATFIFSVIFANDANYID